MKEFKTFTSFSVRDFEPAKKFYTEVLNLEPSMEPSDTAIVFGTGGNTSFMFYQKDDHQPAGYTVLNFEVNDLENVVDRLAGKGVRMENVEDTNEKGIAERGPMKAAWFKDPAGNWIGLFQGM